MKPQPVIDRIHTELADLNDKCSKLAAFIEAGMPKVATEEEGALLPAQLTLMRSYAKILEQRLALP